MTAQPAPSGNVGGRRRVVGDHPDYSTHGHLSDSSGQLDHRKGATPATLVNHEVAQRSALTP